MGQDALNSLIGHPSTGISRLRTEYFGGFELALHSPRDRAHPVCIYTKGRLCRGNENSQFRGQHFHLIIT